MIVSTNSLGEFGISIGVRYYSCSYTLSALRQKSLPIASDDWLISSAADTISTNLSSTA